MRFCTSAFLFMAIASPLMAQEAELSWQNSINGQIEAMRLGNGQQALSFAGAAFQEQFGEQVEAFIPAIIGSGYAPIVGSLSHSFGTHQQAEDGSVLQVVNFVGPERTLYEAIYQMREEPGQGWRVQGVVLRRQEGMAI